MDIDRHGGFVYLGATMARLTGRHILNTEVSRTPLDVSEDQVREALYALQIDSDDALVRMLANTKVAAIVVAVVKHMAQQGGFYSAVALGDPSGLFEDAASPEQDTERSERFPLR